MRRARPSSLQRKVLLPVFAALVAVLFLGAYESVRIMRAQVQEGLQLRARAIVDAVSAMAEHLNSTHDLQRVVSVMAAKPGVALIVVAGGDDHKIIASNRRAWLGKTAGELPDSSVASQLADALSRHENEAGRINAQGLFCYTGFVRLRLPEVVRLEPLDGAITVFLEAEPVRAEVRLAALRLALGVLGGFLAIILLSYYLFNRHVLKPLASVTAQLARGEAARGEIEVGSSRGDHIGGVAEALNDSFRDLRESQRRMHTLMSNLPGMAYRCLNNRDWTMEFVSEGAKPLTGYNASELTGPKGVPYGELIHPDDRERVWDAVQKGVAERKPFEMTYRITTAAGEEEWVWEQGRGVFGESGELQALEGFITDVTTMKRAEQVVLKARQQEQLQILLDTAPVGVGVSIDGVIRFLNPLMLKLTGFRVGEPAVSVYVDPADRDRIMGEIEKRGVCHDYELMLRGADGEARVFLANYLKTEYEGSPAVLAWFTDVSKLKEAEELLRQQRQMLQHILDTSPVGVSIAVGGVIRFINPALERLTQFRVGLATPELYADPAARDRMLETLNREGIVCDMELNIRDSDNTERSFLTTFFKTDYEGEQGVLGWFTDVTKLKEAEALLRGQRETLQRLFDSAPVGMGISVDGVMRFANPALQRLTNVRIGQQTDDLYVEPEKCLPLHEQVAREGIAANVELKFWGPDNQPRDFLVTLLRTEYEGREAVLGWATDIGKLKEAEAAIMRAKVVAEDAAKAKGDFLANMSHEIRTPMNAIIGMSHLALKTGLNDQQRNYIGKISHAADSLLAIINDILDYSKIEAGKLGVEAIPFWVDEVFDNVGSIMSLRAEEKGLELIFDVAPDVPESLVGDPMRLGQILLNLGSNAVKFTSAGEIVFGARLESETPEEAVVHFWVKDGGIGISAEQQKKLFVSFSQADTSTTRKYGGTGLGLAICKSLVELMGGRIWVESEEGKGAAFHFTVRFGRKGTSVRRRMFRAEELAGSRVLIVDDSPFARDHLAAMVRSFGMDADVAGDGQEGVAFVDRASREGRPYSLVLVDWRMPRMDGVACAKLIKGLDQPSAPTVVMVSAYGRDEAQDAAKKSGVALDGFLTKPVSPSTLLEAIGRQLGKDSGQDRLPMAAEEEEITREMRQLAGARVLLVEDNEMNRELALDLLKEAGISATVARDGREAVSMMGSGQAFDGVLMDIQMPVMDGYEATAAIRQMPGLDKLPIIAMTADVMPEDRQRMIACGMNDHIAKPLDVAKMFETIARWVTPSQPAQGPRPTAAEPLGAVEWDLPGIDTRAGLARMMGKSAFYEKQLHKFAASQGSFAEEFRRAVGGADPSAAKRLAHTLKGLAGNIGAAKLQREAAELEQACGAGDPPSVERALAATEAELRVVLMGVAKLRTRNAEPGAQGPADAGAIVSLLDALGPLVESSDARAGLVAGELEAAVKGGPLEKDFALLFAAMSVFEFEKAAGLIASLRAKLG